MSIKTTKTKPAPCAEKQTTEILKCNLTDDEIRQASDSLAQCIDECEALENEKNQ